MMNGVLRRYVLTKDNRIIDFKGWTKTRNGVDVPLNHIDRIVHIKGVGSANATYDDYLHTIKAQSDNVFDLIEVGDLVCGIKMLKYKYSLFQVKDIERGYIKTDRFDVVPKQTIKTIYKQNSKGDYIKVWEVK